MLDPTLTISRPVKDPVQFGYQIDYYKVWLHVVTKNGGVLLTNLSCITEALHDGAKTVTNAGSYWSRPSEVDVTFQDCIHQ